MTLLPNLTFVSNPRCLHGACATGVACWQSSLTPGRIPFGTCKFSSAETNLSKHLLHLFWDYKYNSLLLVCFITLHVIIKGNKIIWQGLVSIMMYRHGLQDRVHKVISIHYDFHLQLSKVKDCPPWCHYLCKYLALSLLCHIHDSMYRYFYFTSHHSRFLPWMSTMIRLHYFHIWLTKLHSCCRQWGGWVYTLINYTRLVTITTQTDRPKSVFIWCVIKCLVASSLLWPMHCFTDFLLEIILFAIFYCKWPCIDPLLKTMNLGPLCGLGPLFLRNGAILGHSPIHNRCCITILVQISLYSLL